MLVLDTVRIFCSVLDHNHFVKHRDNQCHLNTQPPQRNSGFTRKNDFALFIRILQMFKIFCFHFNAGGTFVGGFKDETLKSWREFWCFCRESNSSASARELEATASSRNTLKYFVLPVFYNMYYTTTYSIIDWYS